MVTNAPIPSLPEVNRSVSVRGTHWFRRMLAFVGPGYLVSVGYMDPGNWATDLLGGSKFGYALLWVILVSNLMAMLLQTLCARLGLVTGKDLAQACRDYFPRPVAWALYILCEIAIICTDIAEVIGSAVALKLLFNLDLSWGILITGFDVLLLLGLMQFGFRKIEALIVALVITIFGCFALNVFWAKPDMGGIARGLVTPSLPDNFALLTAVGILGATVMPHNLYLHSAIVQTRSHEQSPEGTREAIRASTVDTIVALGFAFFVNAGILILAAAVFHPKGVVVDDLARAHELLTPMLGGTSAVLFALALLCSGQSSTVTGTLAGQIVMEGFMRWRIEPWLRRLITRALAIVPALLIVQGGGAGKTAELLTLTQVALSMQLPFAIIPLIMFTSDRSKMGEFTSAGWMIALAILSALMIIGLNVYLLYSSFGAGWIGLGVSILLAFAAWVRWGYKPRTTT